MKNLIDVDNFEKRLWIEYKRTKNSYISSGIALVIGMLNGEPTFTKQDIIKDTLDKFNVIITEHHMNNLADDELSDFERDVLTLVDNLLEQEGANEDNN